MVYTALSVYFISGLVCGICFNKMRTKLLAETGDPVGWFIYALISASIMGFSVIYLKEIL